MPPPEAFSAGLTVGLAYTAPRVQIHSGSSRKIATVGPPRGFTPVRMSSTPDLLELVALGVFVVALAHTFSAHLFERLAHRLPRHGGLLHLLGEVEVVFGFWAFVLIALMAVIGDRGAALDYVESRNFTEPLFVFAVMVIAASRPILQTVTRLITALARLLPIANATAVAWLGLAVVPLFGSLITEPAAMTIAALILAPVVFFRREIAEGSKYLALGALFVNVSIGGTLTAYAAPPVLMVATTWGWDSAFMLQHFGWKAAVAVLINATLAVVFLHRALAAAQRVDANDARNAGGSTSSRCAGPSPVPGPAPGADKPVPWFVVTVHAILLAGVVMAAHHPVIFLGLFMLFLGFTVAYPRHQSPLILREALLVAFFLAGLVVLGGMQAWWLQPIVAGLEPAALFVGALGLTAITDNAALTYLGSLVKGLSDPARHALVAGAVAGGGLTVIANAPNPAGVALLKHGFDGAAVNAGRLLLGASIPTLVAAAALWWL